MILKVQPLLLRQQGLFLFRGRGALLGGQFPVQGPQADAQLLGGLFLALHVVAVAVQAGQDGVLFRGGHPGFDVRARGRGQGGAGLGQEAGGEAGPADFFALFHINTVFHDVLEFPDVAGPGMGLEQFHHRWGYGLDFFPGLGVEFCQKGLGQEGDVLRAPGQGGKFHGDDVEAVEEVGPE